MGDIKWFETFTHDSTCTVMVLIFHQNFYPDRCVIFSDTQTNEESLPLVSLPLCLLSDFFVGNTRANLLNTSVNQQHIFLPIFSRIQHGKFYSQLLSGSVGSHSAQFRFGPLTFLLFHDTHLTFCHILLNIIMQCMPSKPILHQ